MKQRDRGHVGDSEAKWESNNDFFFLFQETSITGGHVIEHSQFICWTLSYGDTVIQFKVAFVVYCQRDHVDYK